MTINPSCPEGNVIATMQTAIDQTAHNYFTLINDFCMHILWGVMALWAIWQCARLVVGKLTDVDEAKNQLFAFAIGDAIFQGASIAWDCIDAIISTGLYAGILAFNAGNPDQTVDVSGQASNIGAFACYVAVGVDRSIGSTLWAFMKQIDIFALSAAIMTVLIFCVYCMIYVKIYKGIVSAQMTLFAVGVLLPFVVLFCMFPATRKVGVTAFKLASTSALQLSVIGAIAGMLVRIMVRMKDMINPPLGGHGMSTFIMSGEYWTALIVFVLILISFEVITGTVTTLLEVVKTEMRSYLGGLL